jgi:transcription-repair coupling factor (superfamily II helicase)
LDTDAERRLNAIQSYAHLGAGFKIAMEDLELRGAGNLLGVQQHGFIQAVGFDLYCRLLREAVSNFKKTMTNDKIQMSK